MRNLIFSFVFIIFWAFSVSAQAEGARKIDDVETYFCDDLKARVHNFITEINYEKDSKGYVIVYEGKIKKYNRGGMTFTYVLPRKGEANSRVELIKQHFKFLAYPPEDIVFINGGFRENLTVEFWLVPKNAEPPEPTPTLKNIKHQKRKAPKKPQMGDC